MPDPVTGAASLAALGRRLEWKILALALLLAVALSILSPAFLSRINIITILDQSVVIGTVAAGMTVVILSGGIDLSVGSVASLTGILLGLALHQSAIPVAVGLTVLAGAGIGLFGGLMVVLSGLSPYIVTLGLMAIGRSLAGILSGQQAITDIPHGLQSIFDAQLAGVPADIVGLLLLYLGGWAFLTRTKGGRTIYAIGSNRAAARSAGLRTTLYGFLPYVVSGALAAVAACFATGRLLAAIPTMGNGLELDAIAAVAVGGTSLTGGRGSIVGTLIGVLIVVMLRNGLALLGVSSIWQGTAVGSIIIVAPLLERIAAWRNGR